MKHLEKIPFLSILARLSPSSKTIICCVLNINYAKSHEVSDIFDMSNTESNKNYFKTYGRRGIALDTYLKSEV